jgi:hypothetical protein
MIAGKALIEAHNLERSVAVYPRIVVSDRAAPLMTLPPRQGESPSGPAQTQVDTDGLQFLEPFPVEPNGGRLAHVKEMAVAIRENVSADHERTLNPENYSNHCVALNHRAKYSWMQRYLDGIINAPVWPAT